MTGLLNLGKARCNLKVVGRRGWSVGHNSGGKYILAGRGRIVGSCVVERNVSGVVSF